MSQPFYIMLFFALSTACSMTMLVLIDVWEAGQRRRARSKAAATSGNKDSR